MKLENWQKQNKFVPLTYIECKINKPLIIKINEKFNFVTYPQSALVFASIVDVKDSILENILFWAQKRPRKEENKIEKSKRFIAAIMAMLDLLFQISKQEYEDKEEEYRKAFLDYGLKHTDQMIEIWQRVLEFNSRLEKKNVVPYELQPYTNTRPLDKWRGFLANRKDLEQKTFLELLHDDEEATTRAIAQYKEQKHQQSKNESSRKRAF